MDSKANEAFFEATSKGLRGCSRHSYSRLPNRSVCDLSLNNAEDRELTALHVGPFHSWTALVAGKLFLTLSRSFLLYYLPTIPFAQWALPELLPGEARQGRSRVPME